MIKLQTIFSSNIPVECHILKGRLETDGVDCFLYDENIVWVHPFRAVAVGGVKLKVPSDQIQRANEIIKHTCTDDLSEAMENEIQRQNEILRIRLLIRENRGSSDNKTDLQSTLLSQVEIDEIIESEQKFRKISENRYKFNWNQFWYELLEPERDFFKYLRTRPVSYYIENDLVTNFNSQARDDSDIVCPYCHSENIRYGYAFDFKVDILYIVLSLLFFIPFPPYRKNYYCFDCNKSFKV